MEELKEQVKAVLDMYDRRLRGKNKIKRMEAEIGELREERKRLQREIALTREVKAESKTPGKERQGADISITRYPEEEKETEGRCPPSLIPGQSRMARGLRRGVRMEDEDEAKDRNRNNRWSRVGTVKTAKPEWKEEIISVGRMERGEIGRGTEDRPGRPRK